VALSPLKLDWLSVPCVPLDTLRGCLVRPSVKSVQPELLVLKMDLCTATSAPEELTLPLMERKSVYPALRATLNIYLDRTSARHVRQEVLLLRKARSIVMSVQLDSSQQPQPPLSVQLVKLVQCPLMKEGQSVTCALLDQLKEKRERLLASSVNLEHIHST